MTTPVFPQIGMGPDVWGPLFWSTMHIVTLGYAETPTKEEQDAATQFFNSLAIVIPCPICRAHYSHFLQTQERLLLPQPGRFRSCQRRGICRHSV